MKEIFKNRLTGILIISILILYAKFLYLDILTAGNYALSRNLKYASIWLCFLLAILLWKSSSNKADSLLVCIALTFTLIADWFLLFTNHHQLGVFFFCFVQLTYLQRFKGKNFKISLYLASTVFIFIAITTFSFNLYVISTLYAYLIISCSIATFTTKLPKFNRNLAQIGLILFILCDIHVALLNTLPPSHHYYHLTTIATWLFYLPSQLILTLSSYHSNQMAEVAPERATPS